MPDFSQTDIQQIQEHGLSIDIINQQLSDFQTGFPYSNIISPATIGNGVLPMLDDKYAQFYDTNKDNYKIVKF